MSGQPDLDSGLYADGTVGHSGSTTSAERAVRETLSPRRAQVYEVVSSAGHLGVTCRDVQEALTIGHGSASGALTVLHRGEHITRLTERRGRQEVYVLPQHVGEREESPYRPNSAAARQRVEALEEGLRKLLMDTYDKSERELRKDIRRLLRG